MLVAVVVAGAAAPPASGATGFVDGAHDPPTVAGVTTGDSRLPAASEPGAERPGRPAPPAQTAEPDPHRARLVSIYPDPVAPGDRGEFVVVRLPPGSEANWTLSDGESRVELFAPAGETRPPGGVTVTADPAAVRRLTTRTVHPVDGPLALANDGERIVLRRNGTPVASAEYGTAREGERYVLEPTGSDEPRWVPLGLRLRPVTRHGRACATAFVLPDAPEVVTQTIDSARRRVLLAGYTFSSWSLARRLAAARARGVDVRVLLDGSPVGGLSAEEAAVLDFLVERGVRVRVVVGPRARFRFHHAKYAVVDDRALVLTENWKPAGTGGHDSRGWGVRVNSPSAAADLAALFTADAGWRDTLPWRQFRENQRFEAAGRKNATYPARIEPAELRASRVRVLTAPGNAQAEMVRLLDGATERVAVVQPTIGNRRQALLRAAIRAADRGVTVRILLADAWYVSEENRALVARLNEYAESRNVPLSARVARPGNRYGKIHAKGLVVDDTVVVGSLNWNDVSARRNREVALALDGPAAAYFLRAFETDWRASDRGASDGVPAGLVLAVAGAAALAVRVARRIEFGRGDS